MSNPSFGSPFFAMFYLSCLFIIARKIKTPVLYHAILLPQDNEVIHMVYAEEIKTALIYIEDNLDKPLTLNQIAGTAGFSKYHFHRIFKNATGIPLYEYIRKRRLARASSLLLTTDLPILDIAVYFCFESQEAFTRAFKKTYKLPPGKYRRALRNLMTGGIKMSNNSEIKNWIITGTAPDKYQCRIDSDTFHTGTKCASIKSVSKSYTVDEYGTIMQQFSAKKYRSRRICFSGFVKAENVTGWAGIWMRLDDAFSRTLSLDNMQDRPIQGTTGWQLYSCVLDVPEDAAVISIGVLLSGEGQIWFDNTAFREVDSSVPTTELDLTQELPESPSNLSFEEL